MRKWHRWLSLFFGIFLLWIAITGALSQVVPMIVKAQGGAQPELPAGFVCPETVRCRPQPPEGSLGSWVGTLHHLHSGESFGPVGVILFTLAGFAMVFFAFSGIWLYVQMWRYRKDKGLNPKWLWQ